MSAICASMRLRCSAVTRLLKESSLRVIFSQNANLWCFCPSSLMFLFLILPSLFYSLPATMFPDLEYGWHSIIEASHKPVKRSLTRLFVPRLGCIQLAMSGGSGSASLFVWSAAHEKLLARYNPIAERF